MKFSYELLNDPVLGIVEDQRSITNQHTLILESLIVNPVHRLAPATAFSI